MIDAAISDLTDNVDLLGNETIYAVLREFETHSHVAEETGRIIYPLSLTEAIDPHQFRDRSSSSQSIISSA
jgi:hypothetical protein